MIINIGGSDFDEDDSLEEAYQAFGETPIIKVFVEGFDDIRFWGGLLSNNGFPEFNIDAIGVEHDANGKAKIISLIKKEKITLGKYTVVCMDSDYDNFMGLNQDILNSKYCFQTYAYSIENFYFYPSGLTELCRKIACNYSYQNIPNLDELVCDWSTEYFDTFLTHLHNRECSEIKQLILNLTYQGVNSATEPLPTPPQEAINSALAIGLNKDNMFLFYRGHNYQSQLITIITAIVSKISGEVVTTLESNNKGLIHEYNGKKLNIYSTFASREIPDNDLYQKIIFDINNFAAA